jgi:predicted dehydrogenase
MHTPLTRRTFLRLTALGTVGLWTSGPLRGWGKISPNEKLNLGIIGVAGRGGDNLREVATENIVALCDVDDLNLAAAAQKFPGAKTYNDFRRLIDQPGIDAIVVSTPDHTHAVIAMAAIRSGRHVYCEKPLTRTLSECRAVTETARRRKLVTQLGTQIHAGSNYRRVVELVRSGAIGPVAEVHVWSTAAFGGMELPREYPRVPPSLHYDLWLGPVEYHPYSPEWVPFKWRNWWAFGGGSLADFGCHLMDLPFWALDLKYPLTVEVVEGPPVHRESTPPWLIVCYRFPARGDNPPVELTWYHGGRKPKQYASLVNEDMPSRFNSGVLFVGGKGQLIADYGARVLLPEKDFKNFPPPARTIPDSIGHQQEWLRAIRTGGQTTCHFDYSGPLTETALLGNVACRTGSKLEWNAARLLAKNCPQAGSFIQHHYRKGWKL